GPAPGADRGGPRDALAPPRGRGGLLPTAGDTRPGLRGHKGEPAAGGGGRGRRPLPLRADGGRGSRYRARGGAEDRPRARRGGLYPGGGLPRRRGLRRREILRLRRLPRDREPRRARTERAVVSAPLYGYRPGDRGRPRRHPREGGRGGRPRPPAQAA